MSKAYIDHHPTPSQSTFGTLLKMSIIMDDSLFALHLRVKGEATSLHPMDRRRSLIIDPWSVITIYIPYETAVCGEMFVRHVNHGWLTKLKALYRDMVLQKINTTYGSRVETTLSIPPPRCNEFAAVYNCLVIGMKLHLHPRITVASVNHTVSARNETFRLPKYRLFEWQLTHLY